MVFAADMFEYVVSAPFAVALVEEKIKREGRRELLHLNLGTPPDTVNRLCVLHATWQELLSTRKKYCDLQPTWWEVVISQEVY